VLHFELEFGDIFVTNGPQLNFETELLEPAPSIFWSTDELLALEENEFGKAVPLPCN